MAVLTSKYATLADLMSRLDSDGKIAPIAEVLNQELPILKELGFVECNKTDGYLHTVRTGLPAVTWRKLYGGVQNLFNAYQDDFDQGKDRDSKYIYGPGLPRSYFVGCKISY